MAAAPPVPRPRAQGRGQRFNDRGSRDLGRSGSQTGVDWCQMSVRQDGPPPASSIAKVGHRKELLICDPSRHDPLGLLVPSRPDSS
jgi:hypothetical protein